MNLIIENKKIERIISSWTSLAVHSSSSLNKNILKTTLFPGNIRFLMFPRVENGKFVQTVGSRFAGRWGEVFGGVMERQLLEIVFPAYGGMLMLSA